MFIQISNQRLSVGVQAWSNADGSDLMSMLVVRFIFSPPLTVRVD